MKLRSAIQIGVPYAYTLESGKRLSDYNMEAQGDIVADYFAHVELKFPWVIRQPSNRDVAFVPQHQTVLAEFLTKPSDKRSLPK